MNFLLATLNTYKIREIKTIMGLEFLSLGKISVAETGKSYAANAYLKAKAYYDQYHVASIADDSGLMIRALKGAPGIFSQRYSGSSSDLANNLLVLKNMEGQKNRQAKFVCWICLYLGEHDVHYFKGTLKGTIGHSITSGRGFGYDSIFEIAGLGPLSTLGDEQKNQISHRARACAKLKKYLIKRSLINV
ncbi:MAG: RdgB/HAM1 family non-canonical purine NTP pyrophosphatase [Acholeplasmatales bacterium]|jgi:XTP/dITP diphosphohydrolase|nr:RdgB/HAM1 family non-canonical purine NTP pyrophosphatase [Acholeplasmatales bacterium]